MNSVRVPLVTAAVLQSRGGREGGVPDVSRTLADCTILDVGCGAGLLCEVCVCHVCVLHYALNDNVFQAGTFPFILAFNFSISPSAPGSSRCNSDRHRSCRREHCCSTTPL